VSWGAGGVGHDGPGGGRYRLGCRLREPWRRRGEQLRDPPHHRLRWHGGRVPGAAPARRRDHRAQDPAARAAARSRGGHAVSPRGSRGRRAAQPPRRAHLRRRRDRAGPALHRHGVPRGLRSHARDRHPRRPAGGRGPLLRGAGLPRHDRGAQRGLRPPRPQAGEHPPRAHRRSPDPQGRRLRPRPRHRRRRRRAPHPDRDGVRDPGVHGARADPQRQGRRSALGRVRARRDPVRGAHG
jgi:hypothetical protein